MNLETDYRVTEGDVDEGWKLFARRFGIGDGPEPTDEEIFVADILIDAGDIHRKTGEFPTVGEVLAAWKQEEQERERKRVASWQDEGRITDYDFSCYEEQLAAGEGGPFVDFIRVAADLKKSTSKQLTVGDVRKEMKKRQR